MPARSTKPTEGAAGNTLRKTWLGRRCTGWHTVASLCTCTWNRTMQATDHLRSNKRACSPSAKPTAPYTGAHFMSAWRNVKTLDTQQDLREPALCVQRITLKNANCAAWNTKHIGTEVDFVHFLVSQDTSIRSFRNLEVSIQTTREASHCLTTSTKCGGAKGIQKRLFAMMCSRLQFAPVRFPENLAKYAEMIAQTGIMTITQSRSKFVGFVESIMCGSNANPSALTLWPCAGLQAMRRKPRLHCRTGRSVRHPISPPDRFANRDNGKPAGASY